MTSCNQSQNNRGPINRAPFTYAHTCIYVHVHNLSTSHSTQMHQKQPTSNILEIRPSTPHCSNCCRSSRIYVAWNFERIRCKTINGERFHVKQKMRESLVICEELVSPIRLFTRSVINSPSLFDSASSYSVNKYFLFLYDLSDFEIFDSKSFAF